MPELVQGVRLKIACRLLRVGSNPTPSILSFFFLLLLPLPLSPLKTSWARGRHSHNLLLQDRKQRGRAFVLFYTRARERSRRETERETEQDPRPFPRGNLRRSLPGPTPQPQRNARPSRFSSSRQGGGALPRHTLFLSCSFRTNPGDPSPAFVLQELEPKIRFPKESILRFLFSCSSVS